MFNNMNISIKALSAPSALAHRSLAEEIALLPKYLTVAVETEGSMSLVSVGEATPSVDASSLPWFQQNADGSPKGIAVKHSGQWVRALPDSVLASMSNTYMMFGSGTITFTATANTTQLVSEVGSFAPAFDAKPAVFIAYTGGTMLTANADGRYHNFSARPITTVDGVNIEVISAIDNSVANKTLDISWMAIGQRSQI